MRLTRALAGCCLLAATATGPGLAEAAVMSLFGNSGCLNGGRFCQTATTNSGQTSRPELRMSLFENRLNARGQEPRLRLPRDRIPFDSPPGFNGSTPASPPEVLVTPLPAGGVLMLTALGIVVLVRRRRYRSATA